MNMKSLSSRMLCAGAAVLLASLLATSPSAAADKVTMSLAWSIGGSNNGVFLAIDRGYFSEEGIDLEVVPGNGSSNTVNRVASGAFQFGIGDLPSIVRFNAAHPDAKIKGIFNHQPSDIAVVTLQGRGITKPEDLKGRIIGAPTGDTAYQLFAAFSAATGVEATDVQWEHMAPNVREVMLIQGNVDAVTANEATAYFALKSAGVQDEDMFFMTYPSVGVKISGGSLMTSEELIESNPDLVARFIRAYNRGFMASLEDTAAAVEAVLMREPLLDLELELEKAERMGRQIVSQQSAVEKGVGAFLHELVQGTIDTLELTEGIAGNELTVSDIVDESFLPPQSERTPQN